MLALLDWERRRKAPWEDELEREEEEGKGGFPAWPLRGLGSPGSRLPAPLGRWAVGMAGQG